MAEPYHVMVLQQRIDEVNQPVTQWVMQGIYKKHSELEQLCYDYFNHDRDVHRLHFHVESHNRCEVHLKPKLWDEGVYYQPHLLRDGSMHIIPHFITRPIRRGGPMKRPATPTPAAATTSSPHTVKKTKVLNSSPPRANSPETIDRTPDDESSMSQPVPKSGEQDEEATSPSEVDTRITFNPSSWPPLPANANAGQWKKEFQAAKDRLIASRGMNERAANLHAHIELIRGKYGMPAPKPCEIPESEHKPSIIYHPLCYTWLRDVMSWKSILGWRCTHCRTRNKMRGCKASRPCTVRWVAEPGEEGYAANAALVERTGY